MRVIFSNKLISLDDGSTVKDEQGNDLYQVKGKMFSITRKKHLCDMNGEKIYMVRNKFWRAPFRPSALVYDSEGEKVCKIIKPFFSLGYKIKGADAEYEIQGKFFKGFLIIKNGVQIGTMSRQGTWFSNDAFALDVPDDELEFCLALVIAIDNMNDEEKKK